MSSSLLTIRFRATLSGDAAALPESAKLPSAETKVEGVIGMYPFESFIKDGKLELTTAMRNAYGADKKGEISIELTRIGDEPEIRVPADLYKAISAAPKALATWNDTTPIARRDWVHWFVCAKKEETRVKHIGKVIDMLSHGKKRVCCFGGIAWLKKAGTGGR